MLAKHITRTQLYNAQRQSFAIKKQVVLTRDSNQALELANYASDFMNRAKPSQEALDRVKLFHTDSVICGISALACKTNAPTVLKSDALVYKSRKILANKNVMGYSTCFGSNELTIAEKAIAANCSAVREWDSNGTVFGYRKESLQHQAGEFGHNDFYPVIVSACQQVPRITGEKALKAMLLSDEIRGRLAESFSLKTYKIDHVVHGAIASAVVYGTLLGASPQQIEHAIGMVVAHYIPFRAIRAGKQLSDSKGASAALSTEAAITSVHRAMRGFVGPKDIFRNPEAIFRYFTNTATHQSPFDLILGYNTEDFAVMGMHFKLGLYEHQSAGAIEGVLKLLLDNKLTGEHIKAIKTINIVAYEPAFGIIGDPAKRDPHTRQSADHSMVYIISTLLRKAADQPDLFNNVKKLDDLWKKLILLPEDFNRAAIFNTTTRDLMSKITFTHGGSEYDSKYPDGIPTSVIINANEKTYNSGLIMYPSGHSRNNSCNLRDILDNKFQQLGLLALEKSQLNTFIEGLQNIENLTSQELRSIYSCTINYHKQSIDD